MTMQTVQHNSRKTTYLCNYTIGNDSVNLLADGDDYLISATLTNISSIVISGITIFSAGSWSNFPFQITKDNSYSVLITRNDINSVASISFVSRTEFNKSITINNISSDVSITNTYILLNNSTVAVLPKSLITTSNYQGAGIWTSPIYSTVTLPSNPSVTNFTWHNLVHVKYGGNDYVCIFGSQSTGATNRNLYVCLINKTTLAVTDLDSNANAITTITNNSAITTNNVQCLMLQENPNANLIIARANPGYSIIIEIDLVNRRYTNPFPFTPTTYDKVSFYNVIDDLYTAAQGCFSKTKAAVTTEVNGLVYLSHQCYDYLRNVKIGQSTYIFRHVGFDKNGLLNLNNASITDYIGNAVGYACKKNCLITYDTSYFYVLNQGTISKKNRFAHENKTFTSIIDRHYVNENGRVWVLITNTTRVHFYFLDIDATTPTCFQAYLDLPNQQIAICNDKTNISL